MNFCEHGKEICNDCVDKSGLGKHLTFLTKERDELINLNSTLVMKLQIWDEQFGGAMCAVFNDGSNGFENKKVRDLVKEEFIRRGLP